MDWGVKVWLTGSDGRRMFGQGPRRLLDGVDRHGSLKKAAGEMGMAYTKALMLVQRAERELGLPLLSREAGGKHGGGSALTPEARALMERYGEFERRVSDAARRAFADLFRGE